METTTYYTENTTKATGRFMLVARKMMIEQCKTLLITLGSYLGACMLFGLWFGYLGANPRSESLVVYVLISGLACAVAASKMFFDMTTKEGRTSVLMTPASTADKFLTRLTGVLPGMLILVILGYLVYGYSDLLALGLTYDQWMTLPNPFKGSMETSNTSLLVFSIVSMFLFNESIFIFGSVAWPKRSFLKSLGVFALIQAIFFFIATGIVKLVIHMQLRIEIVNGTALGWIVFGCITAVAAVITWFAYLKFKRSTVI